MQLHSGLSLVFLANAVATAATWSGQNNVLRVDNGTYGPLLEEVHYYYDQWPVGLAVASDGRIFTSYLRGSNRYTLGVVVNKTAEEPYPSLELNLPVDQLATTWRGIDVGSSDSDAFISVQALYVTPESVATDRPETLWVLDTGRPTIHDSDGSPSMPYALRGGPKLVAISLSNNSIYQTFTFPADVHYPDSYLNDLRFDFRPDLTHTSGKGIAYLADSSDEGRPGFIMVDLGTGESWRRLTQHHSTLRGQGDVASYQGWPTYIEMVGKPIGWQKAGLDGIQITPDGQRMYYAPLSTEVLWSIPTENLRVHDNRPTAELEAWGNVTKHGQQGGDRDGFEGDSNGVIYQLIPEQNAIYIFDSSYSGSGQTRGFVRDPRLVWPDTASIGEDGFLYINVNQLPYQPDWNLGEDKRIHPGVILRCRLPNNGTKITALFP